MAKFDLLIRLGNDRVDEAALRMQQARQAQLQAESTLQQVQHFLADYQQRVLNSARQGVSVGQWQDARLFLQKLEEACIQQQRELDRCIQRFLLEKQNWQLNNKQLKSYEVLAEREASMLAARQQKAEQKQMDDIAARMSSVRQKDDMI